MTQAEDSLEAQKRAIACKDFYFTSTDGKTRIHAQRWLPEGSPRAVVQIAHGMVEHIERYDDFARTLAACGYLVCGNDHIGHGKSAPSVEAIGILPLNGADIMVGDVHNLREMAVEQVGSSVPYFLFGHSMGSFVVRDYLAKYATNLQGAIVCGTGQQPLAVSKAGLAVARAIAAVRGVDYRSKLLDGMAVGSYGKKIPNARTPYDWLNTDPAAVDAYIADPECGAVFSAGGYVSLLTLTKRVAEPDYAGKVEDGVHVLFIAGGQDPVGNCGRGVDAAVTALEAGGRADVDVKLYPGMRHEILNEPAHEEVYADVLEWLGRHTPLHEHHLQNREE